MLRPSLRAASLLVGTRRSLLQQQQQQALVTSHPFLISSLKEGFLLLIVLSSFLPILSPFCFLPELGEVRGFQWRMDPAREQQASDGEGVKGSHPISENIIPHLLNMYNSTATAKDFEIYAPNATFEDPLMRAHGVKQIKSAFYSLPKIFSESKIVEYSIQENPTGPGDGEVLIDNKQHYKIMGRDIDLTTLIKLHIKDGKVVRHEDWWDKKPLKNRETVQLPLVGRLAEVARRASMLATHGVMCFGKDPRPSNA